MKIKEQRKTAYQMLLFDDEPLTEQKRLWITLCDLEESQSKLRKSLFREIGELKKENKTLKELIWQLKSDQQQLDMFNDFFKVAEC